MYKYCIVVNGLILIFCVRSYTPASLNRLCWWEGPLLSSVFDSPWSAHCLLTSLRLGDDLGTAHSRGPAPPPAGAGAGVGQAAHLRLGRRHGGVVSRQSGRLGRLFRCGRHAGHDGGDGVVLVLPADPEGRLALVELFGDGAGAAARLAALQ